MTTLSDKHLRLSQLRPALAATRSPVAAWDVRMAPSSDHFRDLTKMILNPLP